MTYIKDGKFDFLQFCKDNPGMKNWNPKSGREILSAPVACITGEECYIPRYDLYFDGSTYKCPKCDRRYIYIIPYHKYKVGDKFEPSGWYLRNSNIFDIIKSIFKGRVAQ